MFDSPALAVDAPTLALAVACASLGAVLGWGTAPAVALFQDYDEHGGEPSVGTGHAPSEETDPARPPPPECPHCDRSVPWAPWAPLPGRLLWRRTCPHCAHRLAGPVAVPVLAAIALALLAVRFGAGAELLAFGYITVIGIVLAVVDARTRRLPNPLVLPAYPVSMTLLTIAALSPGGSPTQLAHALGGLLAITAFFLLLWLIHPAGMGWGDVKLSGVLGLYLGWLGLASLLTGILLAFLASSAVGLALLALGRGSRTTQIPLGPFLIAGLLVTALAGELPQRILG